MLKIIPAALMAIILSIQPPVEAQEAPPVPPPCKPQIEIPSVGIERPYVEEPVPVGRYDSIGLSPEDIDMLAKLVYHEARGESIEGQIAVVEVVLNRCLSPDFPGTVEEVIYQKGQFQPAPYLDTAKPSIVQYEAVETALITENHVVSEDTVYFAMWALTKTNVVQIGCHYFSEEDR